MENLSRNASREALGERGLRAWLAFLRAHAGVSRQLDADLIAGHGLTLNDYDVMVTLDHAPGSRLRMSELADRILLTRSGVTRRVDRLERAGLVQRVTCASDARGAFAELTAKGRETLVAARATHMRGVQALFAERFTDDELDTLAALLSALPQTADRD